jgi:transglutaminase-like putative cysteine protease
MPLFQIHHITKYEYDKPVKESINQIRLMPMDDEHQQIVSFELKITGNPEVETFLDYYGNTTGEFNLLQPHTELIMDGRLVVRTSDNDPMSHLHQAAPADLAGLLENDIFLQGLAEPERIEREEELQTILADIVTEGATTVDQIALAAMAYIFQNFKYKKGITTVETTVDEILDHRSGVCQDFAHVLLQMLRMAGIPARYVSGYICPNKSGMRGEGATHAWIEYYLPGVGWKGIDPTNNVLTAGNHVKLAVGKNFDECTPVKGTFKGIAKQRLSVYVSVGYEDGHVFEEINRVNMQTHRQDGTEPWQDDYLAQLQQQQQQQQ